MLISDKDETVNREFRRVSMVEPEGIFEGYLALWGTPEHRDSYGTWFDRSNPPEMALDFLPFAMGYEHFGEDVQKIIAEMYHVWPDKEGIKYRARLDRQRLDDDEFRRISDEIKRGELGTSSASARHIALFDEDNRFVRWLLSEVSLTKTPAESRMPAVVLLRSKNKPDASTEDAPLARGDVPDSEVILQNEDTKMFDETRALPREALNPKLMSALEKLIDEWGEGVITEAIGLISGGEQSEMPAMSGEQMIDELARTAKSLGEKAAAKRATEEVKELKAAVAALSVRQQATPAPSTHEPLSDEPPIRKISVGLPNRLYGRTAEELATAYIVKRATMDENVRGVPGIKVLSDEAVAALAEAVFIESEQGSRNASDAVRSLRSAAGRNVTRADIMGSDVTGYGDEWVAAYWDSTLWEKIRHSPVWEAMRAKGLREITIPQGYESYTIPLEGADPTFYKVSQSANLSASGLPEGVPASKVGTSNTTITTSELAALVWYTDTLQEDSIINASSQLMRQMEISGREETEYLLINGDTETAANTNINLIDGTPDTNSDYTALDGWIKNALITTVANARDCGVTFDEDDFRLLLTLLGTNGRAASNRRQLIYLMDFATQDAAINIPAFKTTDTNNGFATIQSGELMKAWNVDVLVSEQMSLANTAGKISATAGNNTHGRLALIRPDQWTIGTKRDITVETQRWAPARSTGIVLTFRMGMIYRDSDSASAVTYNIPIV